MRAATALLGLGAVGAVMVAGAALMDSTVVVNPEERAVHTRMGAQLDVLGPGLHFKLPFGIDQVERVAVARVHRASFGFEEVDGKREVNLAEARLVTADHLLVEVLWSLDYRIGDPLGWLSAAEPAGIVHDLAAAAMHDAVARRSFAEMMDPASRLLLAEEVKVTLGHALTDLGLGAQPVEVKIVELGPPERLGAAWQEVVEARAEQARRPAPVEVEVEGVTAEGVDP